jgi:hypothetical protein
MFFWLDPKEPKSQAYKNNFLKNTEHFSHLPKLANAVRLNLSGFKTAELKQGCISLHLSLF